MRAQRKDQLQEQLIRINVIRISRKAILPTQLAEFAWPVGQRDRSAFIGQSLITAAVRVVKTTADKPAPRQLIIRRSIVSERLLCCRELLPIAPDKFAATNK